MNRINRNEVSPTPLWDRLRGHTSTLSSIIALLSALIGLVVMVGWVWDIALLKGNYLSTGVMRFNTALSFFLLGGALLLKAWPDLLLPRKSAANLLCLLVNLIGLATIAEYVTGIDLRIDEFFFRETVPWGIADIPGRMAFTTALNFVLLGSAIWLLDSRKRRGLFPAEVLSGLSFLITFPNLLGHFFGAKSFLRFFNLNMLSLYTSWTFLALVVGILLARIDRGLMLEFVSDKLGSSSFRRLFPPIIFGLPVLGWLRLQGELRGLYNTQFGLVIMISTMAILSLVLLWRNARVINDGERSLVDKEVELKIIKERQRAAVQLRTSEERFRQLVDGVRDYAIYMLDPQGNICSWNNGAARIKGYRAEEILGTNFSIFFSEPDRAAGRPQLLLQRAEGKGHLEDEGWRIRKDGSPFWANVIINKMVDDEGRFIGFTKITRDLTDRRRAEEELRTSQRRFEMVTRGTEEGIWEHNLLDHSLYTSPTANEILGLTKEQAVKVEEWAKRIPPEDLLKIYAARKEYLEGRSAKYDVTYRFNLDNGKGERWINAKGQALWDEQGAPISLMGSIRDITEEKRTEDELYTKSEWQRAILDSANFTIISTDTLGIIQTFNHAAERMLGYDARELVGTHTPGIIHSLPEIQARALALTQELKREVLPGFEVFVAKAKLGLHDENEWTYIRKDKSTFQVQLSVTCLKDRDGQIAGYLGIGHDISNLKKREKQLRESNEELKHLIEERKVITDNVPALILYLDRDLICRFANKTFYEWHKKAPENVIGLHYAHIFGKELLEQNQVYFAGVFSGEPQKFEREIIRKSTGEKRYVFVHYTPHRVDGQVQGFYVHVIDITDRKIAELRIEEERQKALRASNVKSEFLANMSHEIRTPINIILGMTRLLLDLPLDNEQKVYAQDILQSGESLITIINDILDISKIEAGKLELELQEFNLGQSMVNLLRMFEVQAKGKSIEIIPSLPEQLLNFYWGDQGRLKQVLINLIHNAIKFTEGGRIWVRLVDVMHSEEEGKFRFEVQDEGIGIAFTQQERLFRPFVQADSSTTRRFGGTGLGLSICKKLVQLMGGELQVQSKEGKGSLFWFEVVLKKGQPLLSAEFSNLEFRAKLSEDNRKGALILVAEDNEMNQMLTIKQLEKLGLMAHAVPNGKDALKALQDGNYQLVLMDCQMPVMDGLEASRTIRESATLPRRDIPIVAMTANAIEGSREECLQAGMNDFITKPVRPEELEKIVLKWLLPGKENSVNVSSLKEESILNPEILAELRELDSPGHIHILHDLGQKFISTLPHQFEILHRAISMKDYRALRAQAHLLITSAGNLGAIRMSKMFRQLEALAKEEGEGGQRAALLIKDLEAEATLVVEKLGREIEIKGQA